MMVATYFPNYYLGVHAFPIPYSSSPDFLIFSILSIYVSSWRYICCSHFKIDIDFVNLDFFCLFLGPHALWERLGNLKKEKLDNQVAVFSQKIASVPSKVYFRKYLEFHLYVYIKSHQKTTTKILLSG